MYRIFALLLTLSTPGQAQEITMIDATKLTVAELMALANQDRQAATLVDCCDWSGGGCLPQRVRQQIAEKALRDERP